MDSVCENCSEHFRHRVDRTPRFCSMECRRASERVTQNCLRCGTSFTRKRSLSHGGYCSRACAPGRPRDPENHVAKVCPGCSRTFTRPVYRQTAHCSATCRATLATTSTACPGCGETFTFYRSWPRVHCSAACYGNAKDQGGPVYYGADWSRQRDLALLRDKRACQDCGSSPEVLHVHHLRALRLYHGDWRSANMLDNLVTVCPPCHLERHGGAYA